ncbi:hypothetical protein [Nocardia carnea]|uniref:hypothetical protein n=1 Tax=Nocardia carnea TaxID=37328 RepID=UPI00245654F7|nr:hypothetical protein [Nocardia carnea]
MPLRIIKAVQTCYGCPSQWDAVTDTGQDLYMRFRYGYGSADINGITVAHFTDPDPYAGVISLEEFCARADIVLDLDSAAR